ncbi:interference hedgehog-like [Pollicipes pollicipes]|uniref:interference hedgehog-like n=1 Tax=Pollicipes pollicipes TaxID=41117 RepID=UPI0018851752|nr:interference hedgehog-like [Pollicipes pollicipes]
MFPLRLLVALGWICLIAAQQGLGIFFVKEPQSVVALPGGEAVLTCATNLAVDHLGWLRDWQPLEPGSDPTIDVRPGRLRIRIGQDPDLYRRHTGEYRCMAWIAPIGLASLPASVQVAHTEPFALRQNATLVAPPGGSVSLALRPRVEYRAAAGDTLRLECAAEGWPLPAVSWRRLDGRWSDRYVQLAGRLEISRLRAADEGDYACDVTGSEGSLTAATAVRVTEPPTVDTSPSDLTVPEGSPASLRCSGRGWPPPRLEWVLDGRPLVGDGRPRLDGDRLLFDAVTRENAGLYQCFGRSEAGHAKTAVLLKVIPKTTVSLDVLPSRTAMPTSPASPAPRHTGSHRRSHGARRAGEALMVPPGAPRVYPISESSVMLQWDVPPNDGLAILFFKIQYRRAPRRLHAWQTLDSDVPGTARSFEVGQLQLGAKYKFRVLAVYENKDNKHGPNSRKVKIIRMSKKSKPPGAPIITMHSSEGPNGIRCSWMYYNLQASPIEGYFIYYRDTTTAGDYSKVTVLGETTKTHTLTSLLPATSYDIKVQAFNLAGGVSEFSPIVTERTGAAQGAAKTGSSVEARRPLVPVVTSRGVDRSRARLYAIVGSVLGGLLLLALTAGLVCHCRSRTADKQEVAQEYGDSALQGGVHQPLAPPRALATRPRPGRVRRGSADGTSTGPQFSTGFESEWRDRSRELSSI